MLENMISMQTKTIQPCKVGKIVQRGMQYAHSKVQPNRLYVFVVRKNRDPLCQYGEATARKLPAQGERARWQAQAAHMGHQQENVAKICLGG